VDRIPAAILACFLSCLAASPVTAGSDFRWAPITEADWEIVEDPGRGIHDAVIIFEKVTVDDEDLIKKERSYYTLYRRVRILSAEGRKWGDVLSDYLGKDQKIEEIKGRTVHRDGTVYELDKGQVHEKEVVVTKDFKVKRKAFSIPAVSDDCIVEYYFKYRLNGPPHRWMIQKDVYMLQGEYRWKVCRGKGLKGTEFRAFGRDVAPNFIVLHAEDKVDVQRLPSLKDTRELVFTISDVPAFESEPFCPPAVSLKWQLHHYYAEPGPASVYWGDICQGVDRNVSDFTSYDDYVYEKAKAFSHYARDSQKVRNACAWFNANITNLDIDDSGEKRKGIGCASHVIERGYGSSPEICCAFYDMLREMDIDAKIALTVDRDDDFFIEDAKYWQFTRWLVAVPDAAGGYIFCKPGCDYLEPGQVDWYNEGVQALVVGDPDRLFYTIPYSPPEANTRSREAELRMGDDLRLSGTFTEKCKGQCARERRLGLRKTDSTGMMQYLKKSLAESHPAFEPDSFDVEGLGDSRLTLEIECRIEGDFAGPEMGNRLLLRPADFLSVEDNPFTSDERRYDVMLDYARRTTETAKITLPEAWVVEALPADTAFANEVGECTMTFEAEDGTVTIKRSFALVKPVWEAAAYTDVKALFTARQTFDDMAVVVKREG